MDLFTTLLSTNYGCVCIFDNIDTRKSTKMEAPWHSISVKSLVSKCMLKSTYAGKYVGKYGWHESIYNIRARLNISIIVIFPSLSMVIPTVKSDCFTSRHANFMMCVSTKIAKFAGKKLQ